MKVALHLVVLLSAAMGLSQEGAPANTGSRDAVSKIVFDALISRGLEREELPTILDLSTLPPSPANKLHVQQVSWEAIRRVIQIRLQCEAASPCMPLLIQARVPQRAEASVRLKLTEGHRGRGVAELERSPRIRSSGAMLVKAGQLATLLWQKNALRMSTPVVCLRSGRDGDQVPVRTREGKHLLNAQVIGVGTLAVF